MTATTTPIAGLDTVAPQQLEGSTGWADSPDGTAHVVTLGEFRTESGASIPELTMLFQHWGAPVLRADGATNIVLVLHALTGDSQAAATGTAPGWWDSVIGPGAAVDTEQWCVIAANVLGGCAGSTGPASAAPDGRPWGSRFPAITVADQVRAEKALLDAIGVERLAAVLGGSMGGARSLEWIVSYPDLVDAGLVLAVGARATADQIGTQTTQINVITADPNWQGGDYYDSDRTPDIGLGLARQIAHLTYRTEAELDERFANNDQGDANPRAGTVADRGGHGNQYQISSYLSHQADKLVARFDAGSYVVLSDVLNHHDIGRGRGGVAAALRGCPVPAVVAGIDSDRLYPLRLQAELAELLPGCAGLQTIHSPHGHDGFLTESAAVSELIEQTLRLAREQQRG